MLRSGNDAAVALAEKIAGSEEVFVTMMNVSFSVAIWLKHMVKEIHKI